MGAPFGSRHPKAIVGYPPMHRRHRSYGDAARSARVRVATSALLEAFVVVQCGVERETVVGERTWLMLGTHVGHDAIVGAECEIADRCVIGAHAEVGDGVRLGIGTLVRPFVKIGAGARTGIGAVVVRDVPAGETWVGNPARHLPDRRRPLQAAYANMTADELEDVFAVAGDWPV